MATTKQLELIDELISKLDEDEKLLCEPIINYLLELGYKVKRRKKSTFIIEFEKYGRVIVKLEHGKANMREMATHLMFWMRFSASNNYTKVFQDAVNRRSDAWVKRNQHWQPITKCCNMCNGKPRYYHHTTEDGTKFDFCGGFTKYVPGVTSKDVPEILRMIKEQDDHFVEMFA